MKSNAKVDFEFTQRIFRNFSLLCINLKQEVEKTQKSAEAGCLKILSLPNFFFFTVHALPVERRFQTV